MVYRQQAGEMWDICGKPRNMATECEAGEVPFSAGTSSLKKYVFNNCHAYSH